jgi:hypothetical protein
MNSKAKGSRRERQAVQMLKDQGYSCTRSGASLGAWDIVAIGPNDVRLVQCKSNRWPSKEEIHKMELFPVPPGCRKEIWRWNDYERRPQIEVVKEECHVIR